MLKIEAFTLGLMIEANCYLVSEDGHALVIDPGSKGRSVQKRIEEEGLSVDAIVLTHGHFDHCAGADAFVETYHCPLYIHPLDAPMLKDPALNFSAGLAPLVVKSTARMLKQGRQQIGHFEVEMIDAPGHSEGSCLLLMKDHVMFCGDVLFQGSISAIGGFIKQNGLINTANNMTVDQISQSVKSFVNSPQSKDMGLVSVQAFRLY